MKTLLIARHGNTFDKGDVITRVGLKTDLPLSNSGREQAERLGKHLSQYYPSLETVYTSELKRTIETATLALNHYSHEIPHQALSIFNEIDYGVDENKPEADVIKRIGEDALKAWETEAKLPPGWIFDVTTLTKKLETFLSKKALSDTEQSLIVTSNGIARFIPLLECVNAPETLILKMPTGSLSQLSLVEGHWKIDYWGKKICYS